jgi:putative Ca2+/H+ antiporter (TMEM165/GDT1 family)
VRAPSASGALRRDPERRIMDIKLLLTTFGMVFLAELGDKTQLATFCFSAECDSRLSVFLGSAGALVLSSLIAVMLGAGVSRVISPTTIKIGAGIFFVVVGAWTLYAALRA